MKLAARVLITCLVVGAASIAAAPRSSSRLTVQRVLELTAPTSLPAGRTYRVQIAGLGQAVLSNGSPEGQITSAQEVIFPTEFTTPQAPRPGERFDVTPGVPTNFEKLNAGWTVRLSVKPLGKLAVISGIAEHVEASLVPAGYGAVSGPIYDEDVVQNPNVIKMSKVQTTTTRFQVSALPGETYDVNFYRGAKVETYRLSVTTE